MRISLLALQIIFLIGLQATSFAVLWLLNPMTQAATDTFALYLSLDLVGFAILSYIYRSKRNSREPSQAWIAVGYLALIALLVSNLALT
jgi:hypothetical protein